MVVLIAAMFFLCFFPQYSNAITSEATHVTDTLPVNTISAEELQKISPDGRSLEKILRSVPTPGEQRSQQEDTAAAGKNLQLNLNFLRDSSSTLPKKLDPKIKDFLSDSPSVTEGMIEKLEVLKSNTQPIYGSDALSGLVIQRYFNVHPYELPSSSQFSPRQMQWQKENIPIGRLGISDFKGQWEWCLSDYRNDKWGWTSSWKLGESYGLSGPIVAVGKTPDGPGMSIYSSSGIFVGDVNKTKLTYDPAVTAKYLIQAQYPSTFGSFDRSRDRLFRMDQFDPYRVIIQPMGRRFGDIFQTADIFNSRLNKFSGYDDFLSSQDSGCVPPFASEPVYSRRVLKEKVKEPAQIVPNDPLYRKSAKKKKGGIPFVSGIVGGLASVGEGVVGVGVGSQADTEGPDVRDQYSLPKIGYLPFSDENSAWNAVDGSGKNVIVAVIDSGLDLSHPDGPQYVWTNDAEIPDNQIDDDHDGYVDDIHGWNFIDGDADLKDLRGHGTIVAGIIAAKSNNGQGIAGINPGAVILPLKVADKFGNTNSLRIFRAIHYAVDHGAKVINISLGDKGVSRLERLAVNYARAKGVLIVVASGNDGEDIHLYGPASAGNVMAVGAVNYDGSRSTVSNWGGNNSLMAPGEEIYSLQSKDAPWEGPSGSKDRLYTKASGTSFSAPMVAATASLLLVKEPNLKPDEIEDILLSTAHRDGKNDWDAKMGAGLLDAAKAVRAAGREHFNIKVTDLNVNYQGKTKRVESVDVFATVRGNVDYFIVEVGKGRNAQKFKTVMGIEGQEANDDLVARINQDDLRGSDEWLIQLKAWDKSGKEFTAQIPLILK